MSHLSVPPARSGAILVPEGGDNMSDRFPANEVEALAFLCAQRYGEGKCSNPETLYQKYKEAYDKISQCCQKNQTDQPVKCN